MVLLDYNVDIFLPRNLAIYLFLKALFTRTLFHFEEILVDVSVFGECNSLCLPFSS